MIRISAAILLCIPSLLFCQTGAIRGQVTDARTGDPIVGANVIVVGSKPGHGAATDMNGMFLMNKIPPGEYVVRVSYLEYQTVTLRTVKVVAGQTTELNCAMRREGDTEPTPDKGADSTLVKQDKAKPDSSESVQ